ncbi:MAG: hypothetical protein AAF490_11575 [Chloroflexota bacterium]
MMRWLQIGFIFFFGLFTFGNTAVFPALVTAGNGGPCTVTNQSVTINGLETTIHYPTSNQCNTNLTAPYPAIAFAHGFSLFGFSNGREENSGNGAHLASYGYVVAIPTLPDEADPRAENLIEVIDYLETQTAVSNSFLFGKIDTTRFATAGYSLGGTTALMVAARDHRVRSVVALDPVYHTGGPGGGDPIWAPETEASGITVPVGILGAPADTCNDQSDYADLYPLLGSGHKASYEISGASHCAFADPGNSFCSFTCIGNDSGAETQLSQSYMTSWFNYYLHYQTDAYSALFGSALESDVMNGTISPQINTAPKQFTAAASIESISLGWQANSNPMVAGYNLYRRLNANSYPNTPYQQLPNQANYLDTAVSTDNVYYYELQAVDPVGNLFQRSIEVSSTPLLASNRIYLPIVVE